MRTVLATLVAVLMFNGVRSDAASLNLLTDTPRYSAGAVSLEYFDVLDPAVRLLELFGSIDASEGVTIDDDVVFFANIQLSPTDPTDVVMGTFEVTDDILGPIEANRLLSGDLAAVGFGSGTLELQFNNLIGSQASAFGDSVVMFIGLGEGFSIGPDANPFDNFVSGSEYGVTMVLGRVVPPPVPLPAGGWLLLTVIVALGALRQRKLRGALFRDRRFLPDGRHRGFT